MCDAILIVYIRCIMKADKQITMLMLLLWYFVIFLPCFVLPLGNLRFFVNNSKECINICDDRIDRSDWGKEQNKPWFVSIVAELWKQMTVHMWDMPEYKHIILLTRLYIIILYKKFLHYITYLNNIHNIIY